MLFLLGMFFPFLALSARRLHDIGLSAWLLCLFLVPVVGPIIYLFCMLQKGKAGENVYGSVPLR
jgi:uncharacterized membrane protein YhaH (DUF805 family)